MKKLLPITAIILILSSCQKDYNFKEEDKASKLNLKGRAADDPDTPQPGWVTLTTVFMYASYQFNMNWTYQYVLGGNAGAYWAVGQVNVSVRGGKGGSIQQLPTFSSVNGNIITFLVHIKSTYNLLQHAPDGGYKPVMDDVIVIVKYNMITKTYYYDPSINTYKL